MFKYLKSARTNSLIWDIFFVGVCYSLTIEHWSLWRSDCMAVWLLFINIESGLNAMMICALYLCSATTIITLDLEGSSALQLTNHDIYSTIYIYPPSLAGIRTRDPDHESRCQKIDALDCSAMIPILVIQFSYLSPN